MSANAKKKNDFDALRTEASKVMDDLSRLGDVLAEVGEKKSKEVKEGAEELLEKEFAALKLRLESLDAKITERTRALDKHVRANPYLYILGFLGVGYLLGKLRAPRLSEEHGA